MAGFVSNELNFAQKQKCSVALKYAKVHWRPGLCPGPRWGAHGTYPDPLVGWEGGHPLPWPNPLSAFGTSSSRFWHLLLHCLQHLDFYACGTHSMRGCTCAPIRHAPNTFSVSTSAVPLFETFRHHCWPDCKPGGPLFSVEFACVSLTGTSTLQRWQILMKLGHKDPTLI